jgi:hypothetical protein
MEKKIIELNWVEEGTREPKKQISLTVEEENNQLKVVSARCLPTIICIMCGPAFFHGPFCPQHTIEA